MKLVQIRLTDLIIDPRCQMRVEFDAHYAAELAEVRKEGFPLPPVVAFQDKPPKAILADGFHRCKAEELVSGKRAFIVAELRPGGIRDAILYATSCNAKSPLRPTEEDYKKAALTLLEDEEWGQWSVREIARRTGCPRSTVGQMRDVLINSSSGSNGHIKIRRKGKTYTQTTRAKTAAPAPVTDLAWLDKVRDCLGQAVEGLADRDGYGLALHYARLALAAL